MAVLTKHILIEQCRLILSGGNPSTRDRSRDPEIALAITQVTNQVLCIAALETSYNMDGLSTVEGCMIATYEAIPVRKGVNYDTFKTSIVDLPATPAYLPNGIGLFSIYPTGCPHLEFWPIPPGQIRNWIGSNMVNPLSNRLYSWDSGKAIIYDDLVPTYPTVDMKLIITDIERLGDFDPLPIPANYVDRIIEAVCARFNKTDTNRKETDEPSPTKSK